MAGRADLDLYNVLLGFGWIRERSELVRATIDPGFLLRARRALFPVPGVDRRQPPSGDVLPPFRHRSIEPELISACSAGAIWGAWGEQLANRAPVSTASSQPPA